MVSGVNFVMLHQELLCPYKLMKAKTPKHLATLTPDDRELFEQTVSGVVPLKQDKIPPQRFSSKHNWASKQKKLAASKESKQRSASFVFSDGFEGHFAENDKIKYLRHSSDSARLKRLIRGDWPPDLLLDLHGLKREEAKQEIAALLMAAKKQHIACVCIMHGMGKFILKRSVPNWLIQHPDVLGFHQAPVEWGGKSSLLVLLDVPDSHQKNMFE